MSIDKLTNFIDPDLKAIIHVMFFFIGGLLDQWRIIAFIVVYILCVLSGW